MMAGPFFVAAVAVAPRCVPAANRAARCGTEGGGAESPKFFRTFVSCSTPPRSGSNGQSGFVACRDDRVAFYHLPGRSPGVFFCPGFKSEMTSKKPMALEDWCRNEGRQFTRFDYTGHGQSSGDFEDGTVGRWLEDATEVLDAATDGPQIVVGSSMGGWIALLLASRRKERLAGIVGVAASPDFVLRIWEQMGEEARTELQETGSYKRPSLYSEEPYVITRNLLEEGSRHLVMQGGSFQVGCPVRLIHGTSDPDVPWEVSLQLARILDHDDVEVVLVKGGDHRLSSVRDIARLLRTVGELCHTTSVMPSLM